VELVILGDPFDEANPLVGEDHEVADQVQEHGRRECPADKYLQLRQPSRRHSLAIDRLPRRVVLELTT
jgi:hypothetical protein